MTADTALSTVRGADLAALFPPGVALCVATPAMFDAALPPEEADIVAGSVASRRREFAAGRTAARQALLRLGECPTRILKRGDGAPLWPEGIVGSLSHSGACCVAAVARARQVVALGLDVEGAERLPHDTIRLICSDAERRATTGWPQPQRDLAFKIMFSAKESIYKAYAPRYGRFLDFRDVEIDGAPMDSGNGRLRATAANRAIVGGAFVASLEIRWLAVADLVFTCAFLAADDGDSDDLGILGA